MDANYPGNKFGCRYVGIKVGLIVLVFIFFFAQQGHSQDGTNSTTTQAGPDHNLLKATQNPVADLISIPIQNITNFSIGPYKRNENSISLQPVIPMTLTDDWMLVSRIIQPVTWQPYLDRESGGTFGLGDMNPTFFLSPKNPDNIIWGAGPALLLPTATDKTIGQEKFCAGPSAVVLAQPGNWTIGALVSNVWSFAGSASREEINRMSLQYFLSYNLPDDWYLSSAPVMAANWRANSSDRWLVPVGGGFGKLVMIGNSPVDFSASAYNNVIRPDGAPNWQMNLQVTLLFPK